MALDSSKTAPAAGARAGSGTRTGLDLAGLDDPEMMLNAGRAASFRGATRRGVQSACRPLPCRVQSCVQGITPAHGQVARLCAGFGGGHGDVRTGAL